jgi:cytochrome c oxidase subunit II
MTPPRKRTTAVRLRRPALVSAALVTLVLAGCSEAQDNRQNALEAHGEDADKILDLFTPVAFIAILVGIFITVATVFVAVKFRYRPGVNENPKQVHGNTRLEIGWTIIPALLLAVIAVPTVGTIFDLSEAPASDALEVTVVGKQWWWEFQYPDASVVTANELHIPVGREVSLDLEACDAGVCNVIHSFWVPELAGARDVVPGRTNQLTISADEPGTYLGQCKEYCGLSHANMRMRVIAQTPEDFEEWLSNQQQGPVNPLTEEDADGNPVVVDEPAPQLIEKFLCTNCHSFEDAATASIGPNLTHLRSRTTFASGYFELDHDNLVEWLLDAPGMIPMESGGCREIPQGICVGMPSFTENTPEGEPAMTRDEANTIADWLLEQR